MKKNTYNKHNSFISLNSSKGEHSDNLIIKRIKKVFDKDKNLLTKYQTKIVERAINDIEFNSGENKDKNKFQLFLNVKDELASFEDNQILKYIFHRYRYEIFPKSQELDNYPPYLQIEPSSICNYRCVFCFMSDNSFNKKSQGYMGTMKLELFKDVIDQAENNVEFISLASRGEPMAAQDISKMLEYCVNKFLNLKINTNASLLNEEKIHAILKGGVKTLVFSADAADKELYSKLRVNGKLDKVLKNIELFNNIKEKQYRNVNIITRVSGVKFTEEQNLEDMVKLWNGLVDQIAFVEYNPWENSYQKETNEISSPCSDLWRRMFVWWDGIINPCDVDYKSKLNVGNFNNKSLKDAWNSEIYNQIREKHLNKNRNKLVPCNACTVV